MKHLVTFKRRDVAPVPPETVARLLSAQRDWFREKTADGTIDAGYGFAQGGGGVAILNAETGEELNDIIHSAPVFALTDTTVQPLAELEVTLTNAVESIERAIGVTA
jgi:muconolactone delta-isomerase